MGDSADIDISDPATNNTGNHDTAAEPTRSLMVDVGGARNESPTTVPTSVDSSRRANDEPIATNLTAESRRSPGKSGGISEPRSPPSPFGGRDSNIVVPALSDKNIQRYTPLIDKLLAAANKEEEVIKELTKARFEVLERNSQAESSDAILTSLSVLQTPGEQSCSSPTPNSSGSGEHTKEEDADNQINIDPKSPKEIIDLTNATDHESEDCPPIETPSFSRKKREHVSRKLGSKARSDHEEERDSGSPAKRRHFLVWVKVRKRLDELPVYLKRKMGEHGEIVFEGRDIGFSITEVTLGEMKDMICDPEGGPYVGHVRKFT
ncbi:hypothetical protein DL767_002810 [Monosporascus sp. MG133]|nr:hypothetical protein DL767_002810 [Monosporascus sp. MG133]